MGDDAPAGGQFKNISDTFTTADAFRCVPAWLGYTFTRDIRWAYEKTVEPSIAAGDTRIVSSHGHGELTQIAGDSDGVVERRSVGVGNYMESDGTRHGSFAVTDAAWTPIDLRRALIPAFRGVRCEIEFQETTPKDVIFKIDNIYRSVRGGGAADHVIIESTATTAATWTWHTVAGQLDGAGAVDIEHLTTGDPASVSDTRPTLDRWLLRCYARLDAAEGSGTIDIRNVHWWGALDAD